MTMTLTKRTARNWQFRADHRVPRDSWTFNGSYFHSTMKFALSQFGNGPVACRQDWKTRCQELLKLTIRGTTIFTAKWSNLMLTKSGSDSGFRLIRILPV